MKEFRLPSEKRSAESARRGGARKSSERISLVDRQSLEGAKIERKSMEFKSMERKSVERKSVDGNTLQRKSLDSSGIRPKKKSWISISKLNKRRLKVL